MKYLLLVPENGEEIFYNINEIADIVFGYAGKILSETDISGNGLKPLEMVTKISFTNGETATYRTAGSEMYFD